MTASINITFISGITWPWKIDDDYDPYDCPDDIVPTKATQQIFDNSNLDIVSDCDNVDFTADTPPDSPDDICIQYWELWWYTPQICYDLSIYYICLRLQNQKTLQYKWVTKKGNKSMIKSFSIKINKTLIFLRIFVQI